MELCLLGTFGVEDDGRWLPLGGRRQRAVLLALALRRGEAVSAAQLVDAVWGDEPPRSAVSTLQRYLSHLRHALDGTVATIERRSGYALEIDPELVDAHRFERLVSEGRRRRERGDAAGALDVFDRALRCWRGSFALADFRDEDFARPEAVRLDELRMACTEARFDAALGLGRAAELVPELEALVEAHPLREDLRAHLMRALHASGRRPEALRVFSGGRRVLGEELGLDPSTELQELEGAILRQDPSVQAPPRAVTGNLPAELSSFVGRDHESDEVASLLDRGRLVTLTGPGGSGKTRLALHVARSRVPSFPGGVWLVELASLRDERLVDAAVAAAVGVRVEEELSLVDALVAMFRERACLLVIDNCEHLPAGVAGIVMTLLRECPSLRVLATSRAALDLAGEARWTVPPLAEADAEQLFIDRASSSVPSIGTVDEDHHAIAEICRRLDCIPLAIELAAARLRVLSLAELASRVDDRFSLLSTGPRDADARQRTLRATVEWSYELLTEVERAVFDRVSIFVGVFDISAAEAVADLPDVVEAISGLVSKSLVVRVDDGRRTAQFRLLETLRQFGAEQLSANGASAAVAARHAAHCIAVVGDLVRLFKGPDCAAAVEPLEAIHDDCRAALAWLLEIGDVDGALRLAGVLWPFWDHRHHVRDGRAALERVARLDGGDPRARLRVLVGLTQVRGLDDDGHGFRAALEEGLALARSLGCRREEGQLLVLGSEHVRQLDNDLHLSRELGESALLVFEEIGDPWATADAMRMLSLVASELHELETAERMAQGCLDRWRACGDVEHVAGASLMLGAIMRDRGDIDRAAPLFEAAIDGFHRAGEPAGEGFAMECLSHVVLLQGFPERALALGEAGLAVSEAIGCRRGIAFALHAVGEAVLELGDVDRAAAAIEESLERFRTRDFSGDVVYALPALARVRVAQGDVDAAIALCDEAIDMARRTGMSRHVGPVLALLDELRPSAAAGQRAP